MIAARLDPHAADIGAFFWGALIFLALFVSCFLLWKAIEGRRNRAKFDGVAMKEEDPKAPRDAEISWDPKDLVEEPWRGKEHMGGMNRREQEEFLLAHGPRKVRKAIQNARAQAQKHRSES